MTLLNHWVLWKIGVVATIVLLVVLNWCRGSTNLELEMVECANCAHVQLFSHFLSRNPGKPFLDRIGPSYWSIHLKFLRLFLVKCQLFVLLQAHIAFIHRKLMPTPITANIAAGASEAAASSGKAIFLGDSFWLNPQNDGDNFSPLGSVEFLPSAVLLSRRVYVSVNLFQHHHEN